MDAKGGVHCFFGDGVLGLGGFLLSLAKTPRTQGDPGEHPEIFRRTCHLRSRMPGPLYLNGYIGPFIGQRRGLVRALAVKPFSISINWGVSFRTSGERKNTCWSGSIPKRSLAAPTHLLPITDVRFHCLGWGRDR